MLEGIERDPLAGRLGGKPRFEVGDDGTALIELVPTTKTGEVVLTFQLMTASGKRFAYGSRQASAIGFWSALRKARWVTNN